MTEKLREIHYLFCHRILPQMIQTTGGSEIWEILKSDKADAFLEFVWNQISQKDGVKWLDPKGLCGSTFQADSLELIIITLPQPTATPEAYFVAVARHPKDHPSDLRYFTLEASFVDDLPRRTVFGEWTKNGHINYGSGPEPDVQAFISRIRQIYTGGI